MAGPSVHEQHPPADDVVEFAGVAALSMGELAAALPAELPPVRGAAVLVAQPQVDRMRHVWNANNAPLNCALRADKKRHRPT